MPSMATVSGMSMNSLDTDPFEVLVVFSTLKTLAQPISYSNSTLSWGLKKSE